MKKVFWGIAFSLALASCNTSEKIVYLQDLDVNRSEKIAEITDLTLQPKDQISIIVSCREPKLTAMFNLLESNNRIGQESSGNSNSGRTSGYTIDTDGNIDFPIFGKLHVAGMTREQVQTMIKQKLISERQIQAPVVTVDFMNLHFSTLGEVGSPGTYSINRDKLTLLEAISMSGDLTIHGKRDAVVVIREENGKRTNYFVDLRSKDLFDSPAYNIQQNDIIYVQPNKIRAGQSTVNDNNLKSVSFWISIASFLTTIGVLIFK